MLKVIIVGSGEMASSLLLGVKEAGHKVVGIFRQERVSFKPIKRIFRDLFAPSDFYLLAQTHKIPEIKAKSVNSEEFRRSVRLLDADIILVGSWGEKFSKKTILTPKLATINCHPSMLPAYRGPNPYMATISNGEETSGVTFHLMDKSYDSGAILLQKEVPVSLSDTGYTLKLRTVKIARNALKELLDGVESGSIQPKEQDEFNATYYKKITNADIYIDFSMDAFKIYNKVRAFSPWAFCYLKAKNQFLKIGHARIIDLNDNEFSVNNKRYRMPDSYGSTKAGKILVKGASWILCSTIKHGEAILLYDLKLYGFCKGILTKSFISSLKTLK